MRRPRSQVVHVRLEVLDDAGLVCRGDVGACVVEGERTDGGVVRLENGLEVEGEAVPCGELAARGACQYASTLWRPLGVGGTLGVVREIFRGRRRTVTAFTGHLILFVDVWTNFVQSDVEALSG